MEQGCQVLALYDFLFSKQPEQSSIWQRQLLTQQLACCQLLGANSPVRQKCSSPTFALQLPLKNCQKKKILKILSGRYFVMWPHAWPWLVMLTWAVLRSSWTGASPRNVQRDLFPIPSFLVTWCIPGPPQTYHAGRTSILHSSSVWPSCGAQAAAAWTVLFDGPFQLLRAEERFRRGSESDWDCDIEIIESQND